MTNPATPSSTSKEPCTPNKQRTTVPFPSPQPSSSRRSSAAASVAEGGSSMANPPPRVSSRSKRAYYTPAKPQSFSRSAAKRDSVMALGSIAHLQHYFVKHGLAKKEKPTNAKNLVLAIPHCAPLQTMIEDDEDPWPETPAPPPPMPVTPYFPRGRAMPALTDLEAARGEVIAQLDTLCDQWGLVQLTAHVRRSKNASEDSMRRALSPSPAPPDDASSVGDESSTDAQITGGLVPLLLQTTTRAVRSVQRFLSTIPPAEAAIGAGEGSLSRPMSHLGLSTSARPVSVSVASGKRPASTTPSRTASGSFLTSPTSDTGRNSPIPGAPASLGPPPEDPVAVLRKASLEVLGSLKEMELRYRIPGSATSVPNPEEPPTLGYIEARVVTPPSTGNQVDVGPSDSESAAMAPNVAWDYRTDLGLVDLRQEAEVVRAWLEAVDRVLLGVGKQMGNRLGSSSTRRNKSIITTLGVGRPPRPGSSAVSDTHETSCAMPGFDQSAQLPKVEEPFSYDDDSGSDGGEGNDIVPEDMLPQWARADRFPEPKDWNLQRAFLCLVAHLPVHVLSHLRPPSGEEGSREAFISSLSDGTLLCFAYNAALRQSRRPWGFIPTADIHDVIALQAQPTPASPLLGSPRLDLSSADMSRSISSASGSAERSAKVGMTFRRMDNLRVWAAGLKLRYLIKSDLKNKVMFEPKVVARKGEGWEFMLEEMVVRWVDAVSQEKQEEAVLRTEGLIGRW